MGFKFGTARAPPGHHGGKVRRGFRGSQHTGRAQASALKAQNVRRQEKKGHTRESLQRVRRSRHHRGHHDQLRRKNQAALDRLHCLFYQLAISFTYLEFRLTIYAHDIDYEWFINLFSFFTLCLFHRSHIR